MKKDNGKGRIWRDMNKSEQKHSISSSVLASKQVIK